MFRAAANKRKKQKKIVPFIARNEMAWLRSNSAVLQNTDAFLHTVVAVGSVMFWVRFFSFAFRALRVLFYSFCPFRWNIYGQNVELFNFGSNFTFVSSVTAQKSIITLIIIGLNHCRPNKWFNGCMIWTAWFGFGLDLELCIKYTFFFSHFNSAPDLIHIESHCKILYFPFFFFVLRT